LLPASTLLTGSRKGKGTQTATSALAVSEAAFTALASSSASGRMVFIFQLPAISGVRAAIMTCAETRGAGRAVKAKADRRSASGTERMPAACLTEAANATRATAEIPFMRCGDGDVFLEFTQKQLFW
jgi:hypothetical protein